MMAAIAAVIGVITITLAMTTISTVLAPAYAASRDFSFNNQQFGDSDGDGIPEKCSELAGKAASNNPRCQPTTGGTE